MEIIWKVDAQVIDEAVVMRPLLEGVAELAGFEPRRYDLNNHESWRPFDVEKTTVDALSQRVLLVRVEGAAPGSVALIAKGGAGGAPAVMIDPGGAAGAPEEVAQTWPRLFERAPIREALVTSAAWREDLAGVLEEDVRYAPVGLCHAWAAGREPAALRQLAAAGALPSPIERRALEGCVIWRMGTPAGVRDEAHAEALARVCEIFRETS